MEQFYSLVMNPILSSQIGKGAMTWSFHGSQIVYLDKSILLCYISSHLWKSGMTYSKGTVKVMGPECIILSRPLHLSSKRL